MKKLILFAMTILGVFSFIAATYLTTQNQKLINQPTSHATLSPEIITSLESRGFEVSGQYLPVRSPRMLDSTNLPETTLLKISLDVRKAKNLQITWLGTPATQTTTTQNDIILIEDFESDFPGTQWQLSGDPTWGKSNYTKHGGQNSVFCSKGGTAGVTPPANYPNNMNALMVFGPFDLTNASLAFVRFWFWLETEIDKDWFWYMASDDGVNFRGIGVSGSTGWEQTSLNLADAPDLGSLIGKSSVWIAFGFTSDSAGAKRGAFVDDVEVQKATVGTGISGYLKGSLSPAGNPYIVLENIGIKSSDSLLIEPGVIVKFTKGKEFIIEGYLNAIGTVTDSIIFTSENINPQPGDWAGLGFYGNTKHGSKVEYCRVEYGGHVTPFLVSIFSPSSDYASNILCEDNSVTISNNLIANSVSNGIFFLGSSPKIIGNVIKSNELFGIRGRTGLLYEIGCPIIEANAILENRDGINIFLCDPTVIRNTISNNERYGIYCNTSSPLIVQNNISNNSGNAITMDGNAMLIDHNVRIIKNDILDNGGVGIMLDGLSYSAKIFNNLIKGNAQSGLDFTNRQSNFDIDIVNNTITSNNDKGIDCGNKSSTSNTKIINNIIVNNNKSGISFSGSGPYSIKYNNFMNNHPNFDFSSQDSLGIISKTNAKGDSCDKFFNIFKDALFVDESMNDFHLRTESPCLDAGNPNVLYNDPDSTSNDMGNFGGGLLNTNFTEYDFGRVLPGNVKTVYWWIENYRDRSVIINNFQLSDQINFGSSQTSSLMIPPYNSKSIKLTYKPQNISKHELILTMNSSDFYASDSANIKFRGEGYDGTRISGAVSGIWNKSGNPYIICGNVEIRAGTNLTVEPGVDVRFDGVYGFYIYGQLKAFGTPNDSIVITNHSSNGGAFIFSSTTDTSKFIYCAIEKMNGYYRQYEGLYSVISSNNSAPIVISNCRISNNNTEYRSAINVVNGTAIIRQSQICNNSGIGIQFINARGEINACTIKNNLGISIDCSNSQVIVKNNLLLKNKSGVRMNYDGPGGLRLYKCTASVMNNVFSENFGYEGGGLRSKDDYLLLVNNIFYNNSTNYRAGGLFIIGGKVIALNNILWYNHNQSAFSQIHIFDSNESSFKFNNIQNGYAGEGNINIEPLLIDPADCDFHLQPNSACIDAGHLDSIYNDPEDLNNPGYALYPAMGTIRNDMGAYGGPGAAAFIINQSPIAFSLISPTDDDTIFTIQPSMHWQPALDSNPGDMVTYTLYYDADSNFAHPDVVSGIATTFFQLHHLKDHQTYFWKIKAEDNHGASTFSNQAFQFFTFAAPMPFNLISPAIGDTVRNDTLIFSWHSAFDPNPEDSIHYTLLYDTSRTFVKPVEIKGIADTSFIFADSLANNARYFWTVMAVDRDSFTTASTDTFSFLVRYRATGVAGSEGSELPTEFALSQNYPNPFNPTTTINYQLPKAQEVRLAIYNLRGQRVTTLVDRKEAAGYYSITWDGKDEYGNQVASGVYLYRIETEGFLKVRKLVLLR